MTAAHPLDRMRAWLLRRFFAHCPGGPKMLHETLCIAQARIGNSPHDQSRQAWDLERLQWLINAIESSGSYRHE